jgi:cysteine-rich repeat protein
MRTRTMLMTAALALMAPRAWAAGNGCSDAVEITSLPFAADATTCGAGDHFTNGGVCPDLPASYPGEDVFYKLTLAQGNRVAFDLTMPPGATGDLALFLVRQPSCADPPVCAGNSVDLIGAGTGPERIKVQSYPSGIYYLIVDSALAPPAPAQCGGYNLAVTGHLSQFCGNGIVEAGEVCDDGNNSDGDCCTSDCQTKAAPGATCRAPTGPCDVAEVCDGNGVCPANKLVAAGTVCRVSAGSCDFQEICTGADAQCPADRFFPNYVVCRPPAGTCDLPELCTGSTALCPADLFRPAGDVCTPATTCTQPARCGGGAACPVSLPLDCNDGNQCTQDVCNPAIGCLHNPICLDAGADALADAMTDTSSDLASDSASPRDTSLLIDGAGLPRDLRSPEVMGPGDGATTADAPAPVRDAAASDQTPAATDSLASGEVSLPPTDAGPDMRPSMPTGVPELDGGSSVTRDGNAPGSDALAGDGGPVVPPINKLTSDGCSCRLSGASNQSLGGLWWIAATLGVVRMARRRRRRP